MFVHMCVCVRVCLCRGCSCESERERERESMCVCVCLRRQSGSVFARVVLVGCVSRHLKHACELVCVCVFVWHGCLTNEFLEVTVHDWTCTAYQLYPPCSPGGTWSRYAFKFQLGRIRIECV